jgi:hypothetical protein
LSIAIELARGRHRCEWHAAGGESLAAGRQQWPRLIATTRSMSIEVAGVERDGSHLQHDPPPQRGWVCDAALLGAHHVVHWREPQPQASVVVVPMLANVWGDQHHRQGGDRKGGDDMRRECAANRGEDVTDRHAPAMQCSGAFA